MVARKFLSSFCIFVSCWTVSTSAVAQPDPCGFISIVSDQLKTISGPEAFRETFPKLLDTVAAWLTTPFTSELDDEEEGIFFTRQPGFTFTVDCGSPASNTRLTRSGMFGVGTIFKPITKAQFSSEGDLETYYFAQAQNGLSVFVRDEDLRPMELGYVYFFNRLYEPIDYCIGRTRVGTQRCGGPSRQLHVRHHYAVARVDELFGEPLKGSFDFNLAGCPDVEALVFKGSRGGPASKFKGTASLTPEYPRKVAIPSCKNHQFNGLRAYDIKEAKSTFFSDNIIAGTYVQLASQRISDMFPFIISRKMCPDQVKITTKHTLTLGGSINGKLAALKVFELAAGGKYNVEFASVAERAFEQGKFYLFNNYGVRWNTDTGPRIQDIEIVASCKGGVPDTPLSIVVWSNRSDETFLISLDIEKLEETAKEVVGSTAGAWRSTSTSKNRGRLYGIFGLEQHFLWRATISGRIHAELRDVLQEINKKEQAKVIYFYTDLVLSVAFAYYSADQVKTIIEENSIDPL